MTQRNGGRPLPWHDCPQCPDCKTHTMVPVRAMVNGYGGPIGTRIACMGCGEGRVGTPEEVAQAERAEAARDLLEAGKIHEDRGCARCGGPLPLDRTRLCAPCVDAVMAAQQASLFP